MYVLCCHVWTGGEGGPINVRLDRWTFLFSLRRHLVKKLSQPQLPSLLTSWFSRPTFPAEELNTEEEMERFHVTPVTSSWMKIAPPRNVSSSCATTTELLNRCASRTRCQGSARGGGSDFLFTPLTTEVVWSRGGRPAQALYVTPWTAIIGSLFVLSHFFEMQQAFQFTHKRYTVKKKLTFI